MLSDDDSVPYDRPNLSKNYLAGDAPEEWIPLRSADFYREQGIELRLDTRVDAIDVAQRAVRLADGTTVGYDGLLIATGAEPVRLNIPGASDSQAHYLRSFTDSKKIVARAESAKSVVVVGSSFIGLEVAASLRARNVDVHVVSPESQPLERVMGPEVGRVIRKLHEEHGVVFHLGTTVGKVDGRKVTLSDGTFIDAGFNISSDDSVPFNHPTSRASIDPLLGDYDTRTREHGRKR